MSYPTRRVLMHQKGQPALCLRSLDPREAVGNPPVPRRSPISSFPRKREPRGFSHLPWDPAFAGATIREGFRFNYSRFRGGYKEGIEISAA